MAAAALKWGVERRLEFIEFRLFWEGGVNRSDIMDMFDVSMPQASKDLTLYQERAPKNVIYDKSAKRYVASPSFSPLFLSKDPDGYLARLKSFAEGLVESGESWIANPPSVDIAITPHRDVDSEILRTILQTIREGQSVEVLYQSMSKGRADPIWRRITPHAFGYDGFRWHVRAYCHVDKKFKDFLLPRMLRVRGVGEPGASSDQDVLWNQTFDVEIVPHPDLTPSQRTVVAKDYGMKNGRGILRVRYAMLFYVLKRLGLLGDAVKQSARTQHIVALNREAIERALEIAELQL